MHYLRIAFCLLFVVFQVKAQQKENLFRNSEDSLVNLFNLLRASQEDEEKLFINNQITEKFRSLFSRQGSFGYPFDSLKMIARVYAPDKAFRLITWNIFLNNGEYKYSGFLQTAENKIFELKDRTDEVTNLENSVLSAGKWLGALYYKILKNKVDNRFYYTILSLQYHNISLTRKFVEILYFDQWGNPVFGAPLIQVNNKSVHRLVLEYSSQVSVNLRWDDKKKMIIFDHLAPVELRYSNMFQYYGPDLTFDGLEFKKNKWQYISNLDLRRTTDSPVKRRPR